MKYDREFKEQALKLSDEIAVKSAKIRKTTTNKKPRMPTGLRGFLVGRYRA